MTLLHIVHNMNEKESAFPPIADILRRSLEMSEGFGCAVNCLLAAFNDHTKISIVRL